MLEGSLSDFSLPDIFQLIAITKKSGALTVKANGQEGKVLFRSGEVSFAVADVRRVALGARLVANGMVDEAQVTRVLERKRDEGGDVLALLLDEAVLDEHAVNAFLRDQIQDAVFDLMRLDDAKFSFDAGEGNGAAGLSVGTEQLIAEGSSRMEEWAAVREQIPSLDAVLELSPSPSAADGTVALGVDDWRLLALVDGRRTVQDIVELTGKGEFETSKRLADLVQRGFVRVPDDGDDGALAGMVARREMLRRLEALELGEPVMRPEPPPPSKPAPETKAPAGSQTPAAGPVKAPAGAPSASAPDKPVRTTGLSAPGKAAASVAMLAREEVEASADDDLLPEAVGTESAEGQPAPGQATAEADLAVETGEDSASEDDSVPGEQTPAAEVDRWQFTRELSSLDRDGALPAAPRPSAAEAAYDAAADTPAEATAETAADAPAETTTATAAGSEEKPAANGAEHPDGAQQVRALTRDEDVNKGLLLRLIDGLKEA